MASSCCSFAAASSSGKSHLSVGRGRDSLAARGTIVFLLPLALEPRRRCARVVCSVAATSPSPSQQSPANLDKEPHKYFDQVTITVRSGDGGDGSILALPALRQDGKPKKKTGSLRRAADGAIQLPMGGHGGDVVIAADEAVDSLLAFHKKSRYSARRGSNVDSMGCLTPLVGDGASAPSLRINVPVGTVIKQKKGAKTILADLVKPGDKVIVARGGRGGVSLVDTSRSSTKARDGRKSINAATLTDPNDKALTKGLPGEEVTLELTLRVVADIGLVGLPNAGKSSLLAAVSHANPDIAAYPFTTLMPNLGRIFGSPDEEDGGFSRKATVADLPGLIKDAHLGKGLGRMFLRHLRRTRLIVHVVDASAQNPAEDYRVLREELRMYNPEYLARPHLIALNKLDLIDRETFGRVKQQVEETAGSESRDVVGISAMKGQGIAELLKCVRSILQELEPVELQPEDPPKQFYVNPKWHL